MENKDVAWEERTYPYFGYGIPYVDLEQCLGPSVRTMLKTGKVRFKIEREMFYLAKEGGLQSAEDFFKELINHEMEKVNWNLKKYPFYEDSTRLIKELIMPITKTRFSYASFYDYEL